MEVKLTKRDISLLRRVLCSVTQDGNKESYVANGKHPLWLRESFLSDQHVEELLVIEAKLLTVSGS